MPSLLVLLLLVLTAGIGLGMGMMLSVWRHRADAARHKQAERALHEVEERFRHLVETMNEAFGIRDENGVSVYANDKFCEMLGYRRDEIIGHDLAEFIAPDSQHVLAEQLASQRQGQVARYDLVWVAKDGRRVPTLVSPRSIVDADGDFKGSFAVVIDITRYKALENALRASEEKYRNVVERANEGIVIIQDNLVKYINPQMAVMVGYTLEEVFDTPFSRYIMPEQRPRVGERHDRRMRGELVPVRYETALLHKDGHDVAIEVSGGVMEYEGRPANLVFARDIREQKRVEAEREQLIVDLNAFAHTVAHDLKNPLAGLVGYNSVLLDSFSVLSDDEIHEYLQHVDRNSRVMDAIIDELLLLASVREQEQIDPQPLAMARIVQRALHRLDYMIQERRAEITLPPDGWPTALGYAPWIEEVWANYLSNAVKYGGDPPLVELGATVEPEGIVRFWVRDNGPGIPPDSRARLFERFTRLDQTRARGHGLGLSIVHRIIERLDGEVGVEVDTGQGSEFWFTLPAGEESGGEP